MGLIIWCKHEGVICRGRGEPYIAWHSIIGVYDGMHLYAAFRPARFRMPPDTLEYSVGENTERC